MSLYFAVFRHFQSVLSGLCSLADVFIRPATPEVQEEIRSDSRFFPYFKDCIGALDGTHISANVPLSGKNMPAV
jgi:hypothetical protein